MPTPGQHALFERLEARYGDCPRWQHLTSGRDFEAMRTERAAVYLAGLVTAFASAHMGQCSCSNPRAWKPAAAPFRKAPGGATPGASDVQAV